MYTYLFFMRSKNKFRDILGYINIVEDKLLLNKNKILTNVFKFFFITLPLKEYLYSVPEFLFWKKELHPPTKLTMQAYLGPSLWIFTRQLLLSVQACPIKISVFLDPSAILLSRDAWKYTIIQYILKYVILFSEISCWM